MQLTADLFSVLCRRVPRPWQMKFLAMCVHVFVFYIILFVNTHINVHSKIFAGVKQKVPYLHSLWTQTIFRSSHQGCSVKKDVLRNFTKFTGKHLRQSLFLIKLQALTQAFSCEFCEISKSTLFTEHLWTIASAFWQLSRLNEIAINTIANLFLHERLKIPEAYSEPSRTSEMELFANIVYG